MTPNARLLAESWIDYWTEYVRTEKFPESEAASVVNDLAREDPEAAWNVVLEIFRLIEPKSENPLFQSLAAGPVEDLLGNHGSLVIERVETLARKDPAFNLLLGGVWKGRMSAEIWSRIQNCRLSKW